MLQRIAHFIEHEIWHVQPSAWPRPRRSLLHAARVVLLAIHGFRAHGAPLRASALTYYTLLSIVPVLAMAFGVAQGFGFRERLSDELRGRLGGYEEIADQAIGFADSLLANTQGGLIAGLGILLLFWSVIKLLGHVEGSLNEIWGVRAGRPLGRRLADYLSMMVLAPILWIASSSATVLLAREAQKAAAGLTVELGPILAGLLALLPWVVLWLLFVFVYWFLPYTRVSWLATLIGGAVGAILYMIVQQAYIGFQIGVARTNAVYGSFAALPLFLVWVQLSWLLFLVGAEVAFAIDHVGRYQAERQSDAASQRLRRLLALRMTEVCAKSFQRGDPPLTERAIAETTESSVRLVRAVLHDLVHSGVLSAVQNEDETPAYQPAMSLERLTIKRVLDALEHGGRSSLAGVRDDQLRIVRERLERMDALLEQSAENVPVVEL